MKKRGEGEEEEEEEVVEEEEEEEEEEIFLGSDVLKISLLLGSNVPKF